MNRRKDTFSRSRHDDEDMYVVSQNFGQQQFHSNVTEFGMRKEI